jgi:hypothetical protein
MLNISQNTPVFNDLTGFTRGDRELRAEQYTRVSTFEHESMDMTFFTSEGDRVSISSNSQSSSEYTNYRGLVMKNNSYSDISERSLSIEGSREFSITVDGDLSEKELKDIKEAMKIVDQVMQKLKSGDIEKAMMLTNKALSMDSIAGLSASIEQEKAVTVEEQLQASVSGTTADSNGPDTLNNEDMEDKAASISDGIKKLIDHSGTRILKPFENYLSQLLKDNNDDSSDIKDKGDIFKLTISKLLDLMKGMDNEDLTVDQGSGHRLH